MRAISPWLQAAIVFSTLVVAASYAADPVPPTAARPALVAIVTALEGDVLWRHEGRNRKLDVLAEPAVGDVLELAAGSAVEIAFTAGRGDVLNLAGPGRGRIREDGVLALDARLVLCRRDLAAAWRDLRLRPQELERASISLRAGSDQAIELHSPLGRQRLQTLDAFRWDRPYGRADVDWTYELRLVDTEGSLLWTTTTRELSADLPRRNDWKRGQGYLWSVHAKEPEGRQAHASAEFTLVAAGVEEEIAALGRALEAGRDAPGGAHAEAVLYALALEQAGLLSEAQASWRGLAISRPAAAR